MKNWRQFVKLIISTCFGTSGMKYCWESFICQMNHYLNDLARIMPRINENLCGSKRKRGDPVWVKLLAYFHCGKVMSKQTVRKQMHCSVNSFSVSSTQTTSYVLFCFIWFWDGRVAFRCGLTIILARYLRQLFQVDRQHNWKLTSWKTWLHVVKLRNSTRRKQMFCKGKNIIESK